MKFGEKLRALRVAAGYTQEVLATKLNLSKANISKYEAGIVEPNLTTLIAISNLFQKSVDYLLEISVAATHPALTPSEQQLIDNYRQLNEEGQEKLISYSDDLLTTGKYIKSAFFEMDSKKA